MRNFSLVITLRTSAVVGCPADAGFLFEKASVMRDIVTDRLCCICSNARLGCFLKFVV